MAIPDLVALGMDVGGTATRVLVVDTEGRRRGAGRDGGGNPTVHRREACARAMSEALHQALAESGPVAVGSVVAGVAGGDSDAAAVLERTIEVELGRRCQIQVVSDVVIAFTAGTPEPDGTVLVAGTGAAAAAICGRSPVTETDGHGWLLGDAGSGFWIGRNAVRAVLAELDGRGHATSMRPLILEALLGQAAADPDARKTCVKIVKAVHARPPIDLSKLAPLVTRCAEDGDQAALAITRVAAGHLVSAVEAVRQPGEATPVVVTGGVAAGEHTIAALLRQRLEALWPTCVRTVSDGVAGAAWLALKMLPGIGEEKASELHRILLQAPVHRDMRSP
jgi:glucosamine kinase